MINKIHPILFDEPLIPQTPLRAEMTSAYVLDEAYCVETLLQQLDLGRNQLEAIQQRAYHLVKEVRLRSEQKSGINAFMHEYNLSSQEGIALMCLAEALLRVPDSVTMDKLIKDKLAGKNWAARSGQSKSMFVNATTWGLILTGKLLDPNDTDSTRLSTILKKLVLGTSEPFIRTAVGQAMKIMGRQFVMGETMEAALKRAENNENKGYRYSYDMLGEAARTQAAADGYFQAYQDAIHTIGRAVQGKDVLKNPGISVKLSALHPRYEFAQRKRVIEEITPRLLELALLAKEYTIALTVDAEEADVLDLSLDIIEKVFTHPSLAEWEGFGLAVQAYQKRALPLLSWLIDLARTQKRRLMVRLIKGAYWDSEIKTAQVLGLEGYPVFTRKVNTDVSFLACAQKILAATDAIYPMFATHNAHSVAAILELVRAAPQPIAFEFQRLHGMGEELYSQVVHQKENIPCRIYAPVGSHEDLLPYLVRRLLENGANSSFVNRLVDEATPIEELVADPINKAYSYSHKAHPKIPLPQNLYGVLRKNSAGIDLSHYQHLERLNTALQENMSCNWQAAPLIKGQLKFSAGSASAVINPADHDHQVGHVCNATLEEVEEAFSYAKQAEKFWQTSCVEQRALCLERMADLIEQNYAELLALAILEAGKTLPDAIAEIREAVDFCRYYAVEARHQLQPQNLPGPTGEINQLQLFGRGLVVCISPWNFPLAIFIGQIAAALVAGNVVIAKPAEQTPLMATRAVQLLHCAGIPVDVLHLLPGDGETIGAALVADPRVKGVLFTGSTQAAKSIQKSLAQGEGAMVPFVAETGGQNAMLVDSSALLEQVVQDVIVSAFGSAGQRCSALRILFLQEDIADTFITMLQGAMAELHIGLPSLLQTDIGPVIDNNAKKMLEQHLAKLKDYGKLIYQLTLPKEAENGSFIPPTAYEIEHLSQLEKEVFGPVLHVIRYKSSELDQVIEQINATGYGLTFGIHSRIEETVEYVSKKIQVGNIYVNRNMVGAVVGVQPFGGQGLSGTGPKAGGPHYLLRLCVERTLTINTAAAGGNASLMCLKDEEFYPDIINSQVPS